MRADFVGGADRDHVCFEQRAIRGILEIQRIPDAAELTIFCGSLAGASLGFLWYNAHPAEMFMGDVGSLALGGAIGTVAVILKQEILLVSIGGVSLLELLSVILQVASFKLTGKRMFRMAPLHHHFELMDGANRRLSCDSGFWRWCSRCFH